MVDTTDDLSAPLGQNPTPKRRLRLPFTLPQASAVLLGSVLAAFLGFALFNHDPLGGEPTARVAIRQLVTPEEKPAAVPPASKPASATAAANSQPEAGQKTITIIDGSSGARQNVVVAGGDSAAAGGDVAQAESARTSVPPWSYRLVRAQPQVASDFSVAQSRVQL